MLTLRLLCAVTPWAVAGLRFGRGPARAYGVITRPLDQFGDAELRDLFADPRIDVSVGMEAPTGDLCFFPVADILDLARLQQLLAPPVELEVAPRGTLDVIADHQRIELERGRDAAAPGGDDEGAGDQTSTNPASAGEMATDAVAENPEVMDAAEVAAFIEAARSPAGATITLTTKPAARRPAKAKK